MAKVTFIASSDFHGQLPPLKPFIDKHEAAAILSPGDFMPHWWDEGNEEEVFEGLLNLEIPVFATSGNMDDVEMLKTIDEMNENFCLMDLDKTEFKGYTLVGIPEYYFSQRMLGKIIQPQFKELLKDCDPKKTIILSHHPPRGHQDLSELGNEHAGDPFITEIAKDFQPLLIVCGHIHEDNGMDKIGDTTIVNAATTISIINLEDGEIEVEFV